MFSFSVGITSTDNGSPPLSFTKHFTINIDDVNEPATDVRVSSSEAICKLSYIENTNREMLIALG